MANLTKKYKTEEKNIVFAYMDAGRNQPRNIEVQGNNPPLVLLYTNAMSAEQSSTQMTSIMIRILCALYAILAMHIRSSMTRPEPLTRSMRNPIDITSSKKIASNAEVNSIGNYSSMNSTGSTNISNGHSL